ncbi:MAG: hypothetical protein IJ948_03215 [Clostridia bacterium]|nr:hypothetical protein [Clostridia bacterium]
MENSCLLSLLGKFRKGDMSVFPVIFSEFEGLIHHYARKSDAEDTAEELSVFFLELMYKLDISRFIGAKGDGLSRYIAVCLRNKYIAFSCQNENFKKTPFFFLKQRLKPPKNTNSMFMITTENFYINIKNPPTEDLIYLNFFFK